MPDALPPPTPAATLVLMRPAPRAGPPEILMIERSRDMAFAAGALVFPGGRIETDDHESAAAFAPGLDDGAARVAAIRETIEESGVAAALHPSPDAEGIAALRRDLTAGEPFASLLRRRGLRLDPGALTPFARWCPNFAETRRFDTFFYLAEAPAGGTSGASAESADRAEAVRAFWASANDVLAEVNADRAHAIFPTRRNLERLARFGSIEEARADAARRELRTITPWIEERGGGRFLCIPDDAGYPVTAEPLGSVRRG
jgi:8-oxo-dGTP pyrophosphatase MutT (NUDIX family)